MSRCASDDDRPGDLLDPVEVAEATGQLGDGGQAVGQGAARLGEPGAADGGRHVIAEGAGEVELVVGPRVGIAVVEHEQAERLVAEDDRHVADRAHADPAVDLAQAGRRAAHRPVQDADASLVDRRHPGRAGAVGEVRDGLDDVVAQAARGGEGQRVLAVGLVAPEAGTLDAEEAERLVDDVVEQALQVVPAADPCRDPAQGVGTRATAGGARVSPGRLGGGSGRFGCAGVAPSAWQRRAWRRRRPSPSRPGCGAWRDGGAPRDPGVVLRRGPWVAAPPPDVGSSSTRDGSPGVGRGHRNGTVR